MNLLPRLPVSTFLTVLVCAVAVLVIHTNPFAP